MKKILTRGLNWREYGIPYIGNGCVYKSKVYEIGEDFYDECNQFCFCSETGKVICNPIGKKYAFEK